MDDDWELNLLGDESDTPVPSYDGLSAVQTLLYTRAAELQHRLRDVDATLPDVANDVAPALTRADLSLSRLIARANANCVSVLVSGALNAGKSSMLNALAGVLVCPIANRAATAGLLTIARSSDTDGHCRLFVNQGGSRPLGDPIEVGSIARVYRTLQTINAALRSGDDAADQPESDLVLHLPRSVAALGHGLVALELLDSPGVNEARSTYLSNRWVGALAVSDVVVVVLVPDQLQSTDVEQYWRRFVAELPSRASAKNLFVFLNKCDQPVEDQELEDLRQLCIEAVRTYTEGQICLQPHQIFAGSALSALVAQVAKSVNPRMPDMVFQDEVCEISKLAVQVVGGRRTRVPQSAAALTTLDDWDAVLDDSGFPRFLTALHAKMRASVLAHTFKLLATVDAAATTVLRHCHACSALVRQLLAAPDGTLERVPAAQKSIETYFVKEATPRDALVQDEIAQTLDAWVYKTVAEIASASALTLDQMPRSFSANDTTRLQNVLEAFLMTADEVLQTATPRLEDHLVRLVGKRRELVDVAFHDVQHILATFDITLPDDSRPERAGLSSDKAPASSEREYLCELTDWVKGVVDLNLSQLMREVTALVRLKYEPGSIFKGEANFRARDNNAHVVSITGNAIDGRDHYKLGHGNSMTVTFRVDPAFVGHAFALELAHLTSDAGTTSRAPVTVKVNGHVIREGFCPRAMHEHGGNKVGVWNYVTDRWHVDASLVHETMSVTLTYCNDGTSYYWLRSLGFHCALPPTSTATIFTKDVKELVDTVFAERMHLGDAQRALLERILNATSPLVALKQLCDHFVSTLAELADAHKGGRRKQQDTVDALDATCAKCDTILLSCAALLDDVAAVALPT